MDQLQNEGTSARYVFLMHFYGSILYRYGTYCSDGGGVTKLVLALRFFGSFVNLIS
jgi:hypothetical protein